MDINQFIEIRRCFNILRKDTPRASRLTFEEFSILCTLRDHKGMSATQLAASQGISCPTMTHRGTHLDQLGYLARTPSLDDRRKLRCTLTRRGASQVSRTCQAIVDVAREGALGGLDAAALVPVVAGMGAVPVTADSLTLLAFAAAGVDSMPIMQIVDTTQLLQPTVSMAVLRLEGSGCIERPEEAPSTGRRPVRRAAGCVLSPAGAEAAQKIARAIEELPL